MLTAQSRSSGQYSVSLDNNQAAMVDGFQDSMTPTCGFGFASTALGNGKHTVNVTVLGQSSQGSKSGVDNAATFELDGFV